MNGLSPPTTSSVFELLYGRPMRVLYVYMSADFYQVQPIYALSNDRLTIPAPKL